LLNILSFRQQNQIDSKQQEEKKEGEKNNTRTGSNDCDGIATLLPRRFQIESGGFVSDRLAMAWNFLFRLWR